jgi:TolA-binding protein
LRRGGGSPEALPHVEAPPSETRLLGESVRLNREGDPAGALRALDRYAAMYPTGVLAAEARRVRLAALLRSGDHRAALALVEATPPSLDAEPEMLLVRAELRAEAHRCAEAVADFERSLAGGSEDATAERAVFGRGVCLARLGQHERAHDAFLAYRARFPRGRFSAEVARLLGESARDHAP